MLDAFEIITTTGVVLWSRSSSTSSARLINHLIDDVFIEEKGGTNSLSASEQALDRERQGYRIERYTLKWTLVKEFGLIFVV